MVLRALLAAALIVSETACGARDHGPPAALSDGEFWSLSTSLSEPAGIFEQDNLVSNEVLVPQFAQLLRQRGGAYIGVGPEQNYSYIARLKPGIAFIIDIREGNRQLHLLYKALFEMAEDRTAFVSRLFSRHRPPELSRRAGVAQMFSAFASASPSEALLAETTRAVRHHLVVTRSLPLADADLTSIAQMLAAFHADGPQIRYGRGLPSSRTRPSYQALMTGTDVWGNPRSFLASEETFAAVKTLHAQNLIVPVVGDFAGHHALRRVGDYLREKRQLLSAYYASNVEVYLTRDQRRTFCRNLEGLPHDATTYFIGNRRMLRLDAKLESCARIAPSLHWP